MVFSVESIVERLEKLEEVVARLKDKEAVTLAEYKADTACQWFVERGLEIASATILDIGNHILASVYQAAAEEYEEILEKLRGKQVLSAQLYEALQGLGGFRNILVHGYLKLNAKLVYDHYHKALTSFPQFVAEIAAWLSEHERHQPESD